MKTLCMFDMNPRLSGLRSHPDDVHLSIARDAQSVPGFCAGTTSHVPCLPTFMTLK